MSCDIRYFQKDPNATLDYSIDWLEWLVPGWEGGTAYSIGDVVRPPRANGFLYECTAVGISNKHAPKWPITNTTTVSDGTVTWTARVPAAAPYDLILSSSWTVESGLTYVTDSKSANKTTIWVAGGAAGTAYLVTNRVVTSAGRTQDQSFTVQVSDW